MSDVEFATTHYVMVTTLDEGWDDGDSSSWSIEAKSESAGREAYALMIASQHERLLAVRLVAPDGITYLEEWKAPTCAKCGALNRRAFQSPKGVLLCSECRAADPDWDPSPVEEVVTMRFEEGDGWDAATATTRSLVKYNAAGAVIGYVPEPVVEAPVHPEVEAAVPTPRCARVGHGHYEIHNPIAGETYHFHDKVSRIFRLGDALVGNKRVGTNYFLALMDRGQVVDMGRYERPAGLPQRHRIWVTSTDYIEAPTFERVATAAVECYRSGAC